jgi:hypothetical protein
MKITAAFAPLIAAMSSVTVFAQNTVALCMALAFVASILAIEVTFLILYVRRPGDRKDLLKLYRVWRGR